jgi:MFS family permease
MWEARAMRGGLRGRIDAAGRASAETFRNPGLRRLQLAWVGSLLGSWSYAVALAVYAYAQGGASAVGIVAVIRMVPAALLSPFLSTFADRYPRRLVMVTIDVIRAGLMAAAAVAIATDISPWVVYVIVGCSTIVGSPFRPAQAALLPTLARSPAELTAANVAATTLESIGAFLGPALGGLLLAATNAQVVFAVNGASFVWSALLVLAVRVHEPVAGRRGQNREHSLGSEATAGFRLLAENRDVAKLLALFTCQTLVSGALIVLVVVTALDLLDGGASTVGWLNAAVGAGGLAGGAIALVLATRARLPDDLGIGLVLFGLPLLLVAAVPDQTVALLALAVVGIGNSLVDVAGVTLLQRIVPDEVLGRVLGILEAIVLGSIGIGALLTPLLVDHLGVRAALVVAGALLPLSALIALPWLRRLDQSAPEPAPLALLREVEILASLPAPALEQLARALTEIEVTQGAVVIAKGDTGDRFYVVERGEVEIEGRAFGPGSSFGEVALLRDVPRTATVKARTDAVLQALDRNDFLAAVTGHEPSALLAQGVVARRLGELRDDLTTAPGGA